jgi:hypothetical protein
MPAASYPFGAFERAAKLVHLSDGAPGPDAPPGPLNEPQSQSSASRLPVSVDYSARSSTCPRAPGCLFDGAMSVPEARQ